MGVRVWGVGPVTRYAGLHLLACGYLLTQGWAATTLALLVLGFPLVWVAEVGRAFRPDLFAGAGPYAALLVANAYLWGWAASRALGSLADDPRPGWRATGVLAAAGWAAFAVGCWQAAEGRRVRDADAFDFLPGSGTLLLAFAWGVAGAVRTWVGWGRLVYLFLAVAAGLVVQAQPVGAFGTLVWMLVRLDRASVRWT